MPIHLTTLGLPRVEVDETEVASFERHRLHCALLAFIAVESDVTRDRLVGVFWPDRSPEAARHTLSQTLYEIRQALPEDPFVVEGDRIHRSAAVHVDVAALDDALAGDDYAAACEVYRGAFLDGAYLWRTSEWEQWVDAQRARLVRLHRGARRRLLAQLDAAARLSEALAAARDWVALDGLDDEAHHALIDLLARTGRRTEALAHYDTYARRLRQELEVDPLDETRELVTRIRAGRPEAVVRAGGPAPVESEAPTDTSRAPGSSLAPGLELVRLIGSGSVATVYLAHETALRRRIAVKVLREDLAMDRTTRLRFQREAEAAARIHHPNVVEVYRVGETSGGLPFLAMPYVRGGSFEDRLEAWGPLRLDEVARVVRQVAAGLAAAHRIGIVHRDVRPANVLYEQDTGRSMLCDFGLAAVLDEVLASSVRLTQTGEWVGDPAFVSPEQLLRQPVTGKVDVYGLGHLAFILLAGRGPFDARTPAELTIAHVRAKPHDIRDFRDDVTPDLARLIDRCLAKRPEDRPGIEELMD